jgi:tripartite-type tricarboxylate transporter receptor subunit TctC
MQQYNKRLFKFPSPYSVLLLLCPLLCPIMARAQAPYPTKPIRFISPYAPGGSTSAVARVVGQKLTERWGQNVIIDNRPGGNTIIGTDALAKSTPDGYSIIMTTNTHLILPSLFPKLPYDTIKDFAPVGTVYSSEFVLVVHPAVPAHNLQELIALAKAKPGQLNYATTGNGGSGHLANEMMNLLAGIRTQHIPYKGAGPAIVDLIGGQVQMFTNNPLTLIAHIQSGRVRAIAVTGETRVPALPQVPTFTEGGLPGLDVKPWFFVLAPAATPKPIVDKLSAEIAKIVALPDFQDYLARQGMNSFTSSAEQLSAMMKTELAKWAKVIKAANIKLDN